MSDDDSGVDSVTLFYQPAGGQQQSKGMAHQGSGRYSASINAAQENIDSDITYFVVAVDKAGNDRQSRPGTIQVELCIT